MIARTFGVRVAILVGTHAAMRRSRVTRVPASRVWAVVASSLILLIPLASGTASAAIFFDVSFDDPGNSYAAYYGGIEAAVVAAGSEWARHLVSVQNVTIETVVGFSGIATASGSSLTSHFRENDGTYNVYDQGVAAEIRTGSDPNGVEADARISLGISYLVNELWFDPHPALGSPVPAGKTDAYSVMLHELGHVLAFNGWKDWITGQLPGGYQSTYDRWVQLSDGNIFFTGPEATSVYGGPVPLTYGNGAHVGNSLPRPGTNIANDLMNGIGFFRGTRYAISDLDLAILADTGLAIRNVTVIPGDANLDGIVNLADFNIFRAHFGQSGDFTKGDFDDSGLVGLNDFSILKLNFGRRADAAVPEPGTFTMSVWLAIGLTAAPLRATNVRRGA